MTTFAFEQWSAMVAKRLLFYSVRAREGSNRGTKAQAWRELPRGRIVLVHRLEHAVRSYFCRCVNHQDLPKGIQDMRLRRPNQVEIEFGILSTILLATLIISTGSGLAGYL